MKMHKDEIIDLLESLRIKEEVSDAKMTLCNINKPGSEYSNSLNDPSNHGFGIPFPIYDENNETIITRTINGINNLTLNPFEIDWMQVTLYETSNIKELLKGIDSLFILQVAQAYDDEKSSFIRENEYVGDVSSNFYGTGQQNNNFYTFRREHSNYEDISAVSIAEGILQTRKKSEEYKKLIQSRTTNSKTLTTEPQQVCGEEKGMNDKVEALTLELHKKQETIDSLKQQLEELRKCHNGLKKQYNSLQNKSIPESGNQKLTDCENKEIIKQARKDGMRELVEQLIVYAENENQEAAREIKFALMAKMVNCIITPDTLTPELKERLDNLGRKKENNMIFYKSVGAVVANASQVSFPNNKE